MKNDANKECSNRSAIWRLILTYSPHTALVWCPIAGECPAIST